ncbi:MAG: phosphoribosylformylglycinamidine synthase subunit PurQ, partial [Firmicutes bacterium]|nr:phosphoribosylformylglycinamidine synthase subunit PurQ [Bacillota bacterium]
AEENLEATIVANVTDTGRFRMYFKGQKILDLSRDFVNTNGVKQETKVEIEDKASLAGMFGDTSVSVQSLLTDLNCCSQKGLIERFDSTIGASSVLMPLGGKNQLTPACGMAAKLPVTSGETTTATLMAYGFDPAVAKVSPYHGALYAVVDSVTKIAAMGGDTTKARLTFQEYFERMTKPSVWGKPFAALLGSIKAQKELGLPSIGGKDSMSGTFMDINVPPTLVSFAVGVTHSDTILSPEFKEAGSQIVYLYPGRDENEIIDFENYKANMKLVRTLAESKKILSANTIGKGGIFMSLFKMAVGNEIGFTGENLTNTELKSADYGALILEIPASEDVNNLFAGATYKVIGKTTDSKTIEFKNVEGASEDEKIIIIGLSQAMKEWQEPLESVFPTQPEGQKEANEIVVPTISFHKRNESKPAIKIAKPRVLIPVFPGTNCEVDTKRIFESVGAECDVHIIRNMTESALVESVKEMEKKIANSQIIMIPGGFSGGDEPDGSAKFITAVFRNPRIKDAVSDLLDNRDGLMLGICNGFQALIKLGLLPYGKIMDTDENCPTLTYNTIGRHMSRLVRTRIASTKSPWLAGAEVGDIHTVAISHGEGRFIANVNVQDELVKNGQIATQYVDLAGNPTMDVDHNPNGSVLAIEGITSPDGRVFGKMGHSERIGLNVYKNIDGNNNQKIFSSGVNYFR